MNSYQSLEDIVANHYSPEDGQIISCLSQPEVIIIAVIVCVCITCIVCVLNAVQTRPLFE